MTWHAVQRSYLARTLVLIALALLLEALGSDWACSCSPSRSVGALPIEKAGPPSGQLRSESSCSWPWGAVAAAEAQTPARRALVVPRLQQQQHAHLPRSLTAPVSYRRLQRRRMAARKSSCMRQLRKQGCVARTRLSCSHLVRLEQCPYPWCALNPTALLFPSHARRRAEGKEDPRWHQGCDAPKRKFHSRSWEDQALAWLDNPMQGGKAKLALARNSAGTAPREKVSTQESGPSWEELNALLQMRDSLATNMLGLLNWNVPSNPAPSPNEPPLFLCNWTYVLCDPVSKHVEALMLHGQYLLLNSVPTTWSLVGALTHLRHLDLGFNGFNWTSFPEQISLCTALTYLDMSTNLLHLLPLPPALGSLSQLQHLDISSNDFLGSIPSSWSALNRLTYFSITGNFPVLGPIPVWLGSFRGLMNLGLGSTAIEGTIPSELGSLTSLTFLDLSKTRLTGPIPASLGSLHMLKSLDLASNPGIVAPLPSTLSALSSLTLLSIGLSDYTPLPSTLWSQLPFLCSLQLSGFAGPIPETLWSVGGQATPTTCPQGRVLILISNKFNSTLPETSFQALCSNHHPELHQGQAQAPSLQPSNPSSQLTTSPLTSLTISSSALQGTIPESLTLCSNLITLDLSYNSLSGPFPSASFVAALSSLQYVHLASNEIQGGVPQDLLQLLPSLRKLDLSSNALTGPMFPVDCQLAVNLSEIQVSGNQLSGDIAHVITSRLSLCSILQFLDLGYNELHGSMPTVPFVLQQLLSLDLRGLGLTGKLPPVGAPGTDYTCISLEYLMLGANKLEGPIPEGLGDCNFLKYLSLQNNFFSGTLPSTLGNLVGSLTYLDLGSNDLEGTIPEAIGALTGLSSLSLCNNPRFRVTPPVLATLGHLQHLCLGSNMIGYSGDVGEGNPDSWGALGRFTHLTYLSVSTLSPPFSSLPSWLSQLAKLSSLTFSDAPQLKGSIPPVFSDMWGLQSLSLQSTQVQGSLPTSLALLPHLETLDVPDTIACPPPKCNSPSLAKGAAFCLRCAAYCASCPTVESNSDLEVLFDFQDLVAMPTTWSPSNLEGVQLQDQRVVGIHVTGRNFSKPLLCSYLEPLAPTLNVLSLPGNGITQEFPSDVGVLTNLQKLDFSRNDMFGEVPASISALKSLTLLDFSVEDGIAGILKVSRLSSLHSLRFLSLASLTIEDLQISSFPFSSWLNLTFLDLSGCADAGLFPENVTQLTNLQYLDLHGSLLWGPLPAGLAALPLTTLYLDADANDCPPPEPSRCDTLQVIPSNPFCTEFCPEFCSPCFSPPPPESPPPPPMLASPPPPSAPGPPPSNSNLPAGGIAAIAACSALVLLAAAVTGCLVIRSRRAVYDGVNKRGIRRFTLRELRDATQGFSKCLGEGAYGQVFWGILPSGEEVAVKKRTSGGLLSTSSNFRNEIKVLSSLHHRYVVALLGYCLQQEHLLLVYEYVPLGALDHLLCEASTDFTWERRLKVASTAALGLDYLHSQVNPPVIHRDIKSANILVTVEYEGKVADFGLSMAHKDTQDSRLRRSTRRPGTRGYLCSEYFNSGIPTTASDVFSYGVVLLELATGLPPVLEEKHVLETVLETVNEKGWEALVPPSLRLEILGPGSQSTREATQRGDCGERRIARTAGYPNSSDCAQEALGEMATRSPHLPFKSFIAAHSSWATSPLSAASRCSGSVGDASPRFTCSPDPVHGQSSVTGLLHSFQSFVALGLRCCSAKSTERPSMYHIVRAIEKLRVNSSEACQREPVDWSATFTELDCHRHPSSCPI